MEKENPTKGNISLADSGVVFDQSQHRYFLGGKELSGVIRNFHTLRFKIVEGTLDRRVSISGLSVPFEKLQITVV